MNRKEFIKSINDVTDINKIKTNFIEYVSSNLKLACTELENPKVVTKEFDNITLLKISFGNYLWYNVAVTSENYTIEKVENCTNYKVHLLLIVNAKGFTGYNISDNINDANIEIGFHSYKEAIFPIIEKSIKISQDKLFKEEREARKLKNNTNSDKVGYQLNQIYNIDCIEGMKSMGDNSVDFTITDIPYNEVSQFDSSKNRVNSEALQVIDKEEADKITFELLPFLKEVRRITSNSMVIFCGYEQLSIIVKFFRLYNCTTRVIVWKKTQFSPMNGDIIYGSNIELAVWAKKHGNGVFNAFCKGTVFEYPSGIRDIHPTQKPIELFKELITDNSPEDGIVFDPCMGSGTTAIAALETNRKFIGFELNEKYYNASINRIKNRFNDYGTVVNNIDTLI